MRFFDQTFLLSHCKSILDFYTHRVVDDTGGYHQNYLDKNRYVPIILGSAFVVNILPRDIGVPLELYKASATMTIMYIIYTLGQRYVFGKNVENINLLR